MNLELAPDLKDLLRSLDTFIEREIVPLEQEDDNARFFDHRREFSRTDIEQGGVPREDWLELLAEARRRADRAGFYRHSMPKELGGNGGDNVEMAAIREHLARRGLGLHNDLQNEHSVVGNLVMVELMHRFGTAAQREQFVEPCITGDMGLAFGLTEPEHGSDATWMSTRAVRDGGDWVITGTKRFNTIAPGTTHDVIFARTSGKAGDATGITAFIVPLDAPGLDIPFYWWTLNMPTDHAELTIDQVRVPDDAILGGEGEGLAVAQTFVHENRIRQAATGVGAALYCIDRSVEYAKNRVTFGRPLASRQAIQWPLVELRTEAELVRTLIHRTAFEMDQLHAAGLPAVTIGHLVSMCNYRGNRLVCQAADQAMQVHGGVGYTRHEPFEHIYRHHRRYRITEGSEEMQIRRVAGHMFGFL
ncbi:acyl-CoA dehydrogenase family protein [Dactylosporangium sp. NPDC000555]|uniref:acyl-CoA dehydrogenase family protein n=1 Tax=Dactylosporangium sp. NPDC000555 TaxID=3154260 RepID=UPI00331A95CB